MAELVALSADTLDAAYSVHCTCQSFPWSKNTFADGLSAPYFSYVITAGNDVQGYYLCHQVLDEVTLMDVGVLPSARGQGLGKQLLLHVISESAKRAASMIFLEVRASNHTAISLYQACGFSHIDVRKNYYPTASGREDACIMRLELTAH